MKTIKLLVLGMILAIAGTAQGQISVNLHLGTAPAWGPRGYDHARYYYLPDVEAYYDVNTAMFIYLSGNSWIRRSYLPSRYRGYDLYHGRKVVMSNYHGNSPYYYHKVYRAKYGRGIQSAPQQRIENRGNSNNNHRPVVDNRIQGNDKGNSNTKKSGHNGNDNDNRKK
ncbi:MAG: hypothetical protein NTY32_01150 [Bacteroidia bacterium]|nr:hypothetical protein [Bacteroidia bacterium]